MHLTKEQVEILLKNYPEILSQNAEIKISPGCKKTDGYVSYIHKVTINNISKSNSNNNTETQELIVKCAPEDITHRELMGVRELYLSEIYFYATILPEFYKLEAEKVPKMPKFITAVTTPFKEVLVLEDVRQFGYGMRDKTLFLDEKHVKFVLGEFGKLHAFSFALKFKNCELYESLVKGLKDIHGGKNCNLNDETNSWYRATLKQTKELFQAQEDVNIFKKLEYIEDHLEEYCEGFLEYKGPFGVVSHMDCWSNNMLFRYNNNTLDSICFLDFQYVWVVSPAVDFSFIFYVNGKPEEYPKLDEYLQHYYDSLKSHSKLLGLNIEEVYSYSMFLEEIFAYAKYGFLRGLIGIPMSMRQNEDIIDVKDVVSNGMDTSKAFGVEKWHSECADWMRKLTLHMVEHNFI